MPENTPRAAREALARGGGRVPLVPAQGRGLGRRRTAGALEEQVVQVADALAAVDVDAVPDTTVPALLAALGAVQGATAALETRLAARLVRETTLDRQAAQHPDRLLSVREGAARAGVSVQYIYEHQRDLPFVVRVGTRSLRVSEARLTRYIAARAARTHTQSW
jgi:predicted DNA-binding transcriptional regulator AlpA